MIETDISLVDAVDIYVTYEQGHIRLEKTKADMEVTDEALYVKLTQEETLMFGKNRSHCGQTKQEPGQAQVRAVFADGSAVASNIMTFNVLPILKEGVI